MHQCPKCLAKAVYYERDLGLERNVCCVCGFAQVPHSSYFQSPERQVTGRNDWFGVGDIKAQFKQGGSGSRIEDGERDESILPPIANEKIKRTPKPFTWRKQQ